MGCFRLHFTKIITDSEQTILEKIQFHHCVEKNFEDYMAESTLDKVHVKFWGDDGKLKLCEKHSGQLI